MAVGEGTGDAVEVCDGRDAAVGKGEGEGVPVGVNVADMVALGDGRPCGVARGVANEDDGLAAVTIGVAAGVTADRVEVGDMVAVMTGDGDAGTS